MLDAPDCSEWCSNMSSTGDAGGRGLRIRTGVGVESREWFAVPCPGSTNDSQGQVVGALAIEPANCSCWVAALIVRQANAGVAPGEERSTSLSVTLPRSTQGEAGSFAYLGPLFREVIHERAIPDRRGHTRSRLVLSSRDPKLNRPSHAWQ